MNNIVKMIAIIKMITIVIVLHFLACHLVNHYKIVKLSLIINEMKTFYWPLLYPVNLYKYTKKLGFSTRVGTIVDWKKLLKQAGVVHNIKSQ